LTVAIVTDSAASLPEPVATEAKVAVVPMWLSLGSTAVRDGELSLEEISTRLDDRFSTSGPTPGEFVEAVTAADRGDGVLLLTLSSAMSSTFATAQLAAGMVEGVRVAVLDTGTAAGAEGLVVLAAAAKAATGASLDEVEAAARKASAEVRLVATLPSLEHLARGGRVPGAAAWASRWLNLHPIFEFRRGRVRPLRPARGPRSARQRVLATWADTFVERAALHVAVMHALDEQGAESLLAEVCRRVEPATAFICSFSPVMVAHTGPGLIGLAWRWEV
jgi:fatty acid kinase fatty acid binding subunit